MVTLRRKEIYRYLGFRNTQPPEDMVQRVETCVEEMERAAVFRTTHKRFPVTITAPNTVETASLTIYSKHLYKNLSGCDYVYLFAATVGIGIDRLIKRGEVGGMIDALIYQAAGAEMIEAYVDELNTKLKLQAAAEGYKLRPRFSPGYGDLPIDLQRDFSRILQLPKTCGITLTNTLLMVPSKSVTAFIGCTKETPVKDESVYLADVVNPWEATRPGAGVSTQETENTNVEKCRFCTKGDCEFRL